MKKATLLKTHNGEQENQYRHKLSRTLLQYIRRHTHHPCFLDLQSLKEFLTKFEEIKKQGRVLISEDLGGGGGRRLELSRLEIEEQISQKDSLFPRQLLRHQNGIGRRGKED